MHALQVHRGPKVREPDAHDLNGHDFNGHDFNGQGDNSEPQPLQGHIVASPGGATDSIGSFVDMATIRQRVALIKNRWSPETVRARAIEGARRRVELEGFVANLVDFDAEEHCGGDNGLRVFM